MKPNASQKLNISQIRTFGKWSGFTTKMLLLTIQMEELKWDAPFNAQHYKESLSQKKMILAMKLYTAIQCLKHLFLADWQEWLLTAMPKKYGSSPEAVKSYTMLKASFLGHIDYTVTILTMPKKDVFFLMSSSSDWQLYRVELQLY